MRLSVNEKNTISNMGSVFTNPVKVISELVQNARRAGATAIKVEASVSDDKTLNISVIDDGCGVCDIATLLCLSQSGWDDAVVKQDNAYGMGFFSTLFAAKEVIVRSNGQSILIDTEAARNMEDIGEMQFCAAAPTKGTVITLLGVALHNGFEIVKRKIDELAEYSSVPLFFNNEELARPEALDSLKKKHPFVETPFGTLIIKSLFTEELFIILQDIKIYSEGYTYRTVDKNVLFANNTVKARMPDRDCLIDQNAQVKAISSWIAEYYTGRLRAIRQEMMDDIAFVKKYFDAIVKYDKKCLNDIDFLPADAFSGFCYPVRRADYSTDNYQIGDVTQASAAQEMFISQDGFDMEETPLLANFAYFSNASYLVKNLDKDHWIYRFIKADLTERDMVVSLTGAQQVEYDLDYIGRGLAVVADKIEISNSAIGKTVLVDHVGFSPDADYRFDENNIGALLIDGIEAGFTPQLLLPKGIVVSEQMLLQCSSYEDDNETWLDSDLDRDVDSLHRQILAATGGDPCSVLSDLIGTLPPALITALQGKVLTLQLVDNKLAISAAA